MKILLEELPHQEDSLKAIMESFTGIDRTSDDPNAGDVYANPLIQGKYRESSNIDVKMETGTGKTYVYTRLIYEMHQQHGIFKFVIVVPSPAIKEGTKNFIQSDYAKQHFAQFYENTRIELNVINAGDFKGKSGRKNFPAHLLNFVEGSRQNSNTIQVLLINAGMLNSSSMKKNRNTHSTYSPIISAHFAHAFLFSGILREKHCQIGHIKLISSWHTHCSLQFRHLRIAKSLISRG